MIVYKFLFLWVLLLVASCCVLFFATLAYHSLGHNGTIMATIIAGAGAAALTITLKSDE